MLKLTRARRTVASAAATMALAAGITLTGVGSANAAVVNMECTGYSPVADGYNIGVCIQLDNYTGLYYGWLQMWGQPRGTTDVRWFSTFSYHCGNQAEYTLDTNTGIAPQGGTNTTYRTYYASASPQCTYTEYAYFTESGNYKQGKSITWTSP